jgi:hypothetical protein
MYAKFKLVIMCLDGVLLGAKETESVFTLSVKMSRFDSPLVNGCLKPVDSLSPRVYILG